MTYLMVALHGDVAVAESSELRDWAKAIVDETRAPTSAGGMGPDRHDRLARRLSEVRAELRRRGEAACEHHHFSARCDVNRLGDGEAVSAFMADLRIRCSDCGEAFAFVCPDVGVLSDRPARSVDRLELRLPIEPETQPDVYRLESGFCVTGKGQ